MAALMRQPKWKRRKEARPGEIVAAALKVFGARGYAASRLEEVAAEAGVSKAAVYRYFANKEALFEAGVAQAKPLFLRAKGCHGMELYRSIEHPQRYTLVVSWETVENHMVDFRESTDFQEWRKLVGGFFVEPPQVHHEQKVI